MSRDKLLKFLKESKILISKATPEQKMKIVRLLRENARFLLTVEQKSSKSSNLDYLDEK